MTENDYDILMWKQIMGEVDLTIPILPEDFIHIQVHHLITLLRHKENEVKNYSLEAKTKERVIENIYNSTAQPFKTTEQQLGKFFTNIIDSLVLFRDEVLIDFPKHNKEIVK